MVTAGVARLGQREPAGVRGAGGEQGDDGEGAVDEEVAEGQSAQGMAP